MEVESLLTLPPAVLVVTGFLVVAALGAIAVVALGAMMQNGAAVHRVAEDWGAEHANVVEWAQGEGYVRAGGELWRARSEETLAAGDEVVIVRTEGLVLEVRRRADRDQAPAT
jgi:membrane-bound ClpP family serine protease